MEPLHLIGQPMYTDDHCGRYAGVFEQPAPLRNSLTIAGEDDCFGRVRRNIDRDLPSTVVVERLGDKLSRDCAGLTLLAIGLIGCLLLHGGFPALTDYSERAKAGRARRTSSGAGRTRKSAWASA